MGRRYAPGAKQRSMRRPHLSVILSPAHCNLVGIHIFAGVYYAVTCFFATIKRLISAHRFRRSLHLWRDRVHVACHEVSTPPVLCHLVPQSHLIHEGAMGLPPRDGPDAPS